MVVFADASDPVANAAALALLHKIKFNLPTEVSAALYFKEEVWLSKPIEKTRS